VDHEKYRVRIVLALDEHSLFDAIDLNPGPFRNAVGECPPVAIKKEPGFAPTPQQKCAEKSHY
jgi:hypothetical protein